MLTTVEKVLLLQEVDIFENTLTEDLSHIAAITEHVEVKEKSDIYKEGDRANAMYIVIDGSVRLHHNNQQVTVAKAKDVFGSWALIDDEARVTSATTLSEVHLLRIDREDFFDLLADHTNITQGLLKTLSKRLRGLIERVRVDTHK